MAIAGHRTLMRRQCGCRGARCELVLDCHDPAQPAGQCCRTSNFLRQATRGQRHTGAVGIDQRQHALGQAGEFDLAIGRRFNDDGLERHAQCGFHGRFPTGLDLQQGAEPRCLLQTLLAEPGTEIALVLTQGRMLQGLQRGQSAARGA